MFLRFVAFKKAVCGPSKGLKDSKHDISVLNRLNH